MAEGSAGVVHRHTNCKEKRVLEGRVACSTPDRPECQVSSIEGRVLAKSYGWHIDEKEGRMTGPDDTFPELWLERRESHGYSTGCVDRENGTVVVLPHLGGLDGPVISGQGGRFQLPMARACRVQILSNTRSLTLRPYPMFLGRPGRHFSRL